MDLTFPFDHKYCIVEEQFHFRWCDIFPPTLQLIGLCMTVTTFLFC